jgi:hypothetical protein
VALAFLLYAPPALAAVDCAIEELDGAKWVVPLSPFPVRTSGSGSFVSQPGSRLRVVNLQPALDGLDIEIRLDQGEGSMAVSASELLDVAFQDDFDHELESCFKEQRLAYAQRLFAKAFELMQDGRTEEAKGLFETGLRYNPASAAGHFYLAEIRRDAGWLDPETGVHYWLAYSLDPTSEEGISALVELQHDWNCVSDMKKFDWRDVPFPNGLYLDVKLILGSFRYGACVPA